MLLVTKSGTILESYCTKDYTPLHPIHTITHRKIRDYIGPTFFRAKADIDKVIQTKQPLEGSFYMWGNKKMPRWVRAVVPDRQFFVNEEPVAIIILKKEPFKIKLEPFS